MFSVIRAPSVSLRVAEVPAAEAAAAGDLPGPHDGGLHQRPHQRQVRPAADHAGAAPGDGHGELGLVESSAVKRSIGFTIGFHNHSWGLLLVESAY